MYTILLHKLENIKWGVWEGDVCVPLPLQPPPLGGLLFSHCFQPENMSRQNSNGECSLSRQWCSGVPVGTAVSL